MLPRDPYARMKELQRRAELAEARKELPEECIKLNWWDIAAKLRDGYSAKNCKVLFLAETSFDCGALRELRELAHHFTALEELLLERNWIKDFAAEALRLLLPTLKKLKVLHLSINPFAFAGESIAAVLAQTRLQEVELTKVGLSRIGARALLLAATKSSTLTTLNIGGNYLEDAVSDIIEIIPYCRTLEVLVLGLYTRKVKVHKSDSKSCDLSESSDSESFSFCDEDFDKYGNWMGDGDGALSHEFCEIVRAAMKNCTSQLLVDFAFYQNRRNTARGELPLYRSSTVTSANDAQEFKRDILDTLQCNRTIRLYRRRVCFLGDSHAGKTWTARSLSGEPNIHPWRREQGEEEQGKSTACLTIREFISSDVDFRGASKSRMATAESTERLTSSDTADHASSEQFGIGRRISNVQHVHDIAHQCLPPRHPCPGTTFPKDAACHFALWDFEGHLMYQSLYQFFLSPDVIPCVVFNIATIVGGDRNSASREVKRAIQRIVHYAFQAVRFGGSSTRVLLLGTHVDRLIPDSGSGAFASDERLNVAKEAFELIVDASPPFLAGRYVSFNDHRGCFRKNTMRVGVCPVDNTFCAPIPRTSPQCLDSGLDELERYLVHQCLWGGSDSDCTQNIPSMSSQSEKNIVPYHWYGFELQLRRHPEFSAMNLCTVGKLCDYYQEYTEVPFDSSVFRAMLRSLHEGGAVVMDLQSLDGQAAETDMDLGDWAESIVILRPQWLLEVGQALLPQPQETRRSYLVRVTTEWTGIPRIAEVAKTFYTCAIADGQLLHSALTSGTEISPSMFDALIRLFEARLFLCRLHDKSTNAKEGLWFVPSVVAFHAEFCVGDVPSNIVNRSASDFSISLDIDWVPPGFPLLLVGELMQRIEHQPTFAIAHESGMIQFAVTLPGFLKAVYIDLPDGCDGGRIEVWTQRDTPLEHYVEPLMRRMLRPLCTTCSRLCVAPMMAAPVRTVERGLFLSLKVPLIPEDHATCTVNWRLEEACCNRHSMFPEGCSGSATSQLYQRVLQDYQDELNVPSGWLASRDETSTVSNV